MATAYIVAATPSSPEPKRIANLKSAKAEADARAKLDRVDVEVRTEATDKLSYTAQGAITAPEAPAPAAPVTETPEAADEDAPAAPAPSDQEGEGSMDMSGFEAALAEIVGTDGDDADGDDEGSQDDEDDTDGDAPAPAADAPAQDADRGQAACGCSVDAIVRTGEHNPKTCANAPKAQAAVKAVERDRPARKAATGSGARRESLGDSVADGWELLYDKPRQKAQVGRNSEGKYALICTTHKHAHPLARLVSERGLRGGKRSVWCPECTD